MEEYEEYSVYANAPYLLHEGHSIEDVEKEILDYGLTGKIDQELTDSLSTTIVKDDKVIHSVRGTDFTSRKDLISDLGIMLSHPIARKGFNTMFSIYGINFNNYLIPIKDDILNQVTQPTPEFYKNQLYTLTDWKEYMTAVAEDPDDVLPEWSFTDWEDEIESIEKKIKKAKTLQEKATLNNLQYNLIKGAGIIVADYFANKYKEEERINPEKVKLEKIKQKYSNKKIELVGHSLGSIVNVLGRKEGIKTITFNPAPQYEEKEPHPESKIFRTRGDPVSFFLSAQDTEPVTEIKPKLNAKFLPMKKEDFILYQLHTIEQFLPKKENKLPQKILPLTVEEPEEPYCRKNPDDPNCKVLKSQDDR